MPFKSKRQQRFLFSQKPDVAQRFRRDYPNQDLKSLPETAPGSKKTKKHGKKGAHGAAARFKMKGK